MDTEDRRKPLLKRAWTVFVDLFLETPKFFINHYFGGRKSEPNLLKFFRTLCLLIIYTVLWGYLAWLVKDYLEFERTISLNREQAEDIDMPSILFVSDNRFFVYCIVYSDSDESNCDDEVKPLTNDELVTFELFPEQTGWLFKTNRKFESEETQLAFIVQLEDADDPDGDTPLINVFHPDSSPDNKEFEKTDRLSKKAEEKFFINSLTKFNEYSLSFQQRNEISLVQHERMYFINTWITKLLGYRNDKHSFLYFTSTFQSASAPLYNISGTATVLVSMESFVMIQEELHAGSSVFDVLNSIGGLLGFIFPIYFVFFGSNALSPWGCCHLAIFRNRQKRALKKYYHAHKYHTWDTEHMPFSGVEQTSQPRDEKRKSVANRIGEVKTETLSIFAPLKFWGKSAPEEPNLDPPPGTDALGALTRRVQYLEMFMKDYVVDAALAEDLLEKDHNVLGASNKEAMEDTSTANNNIV